MIAPSRRDVPDYAALFEASPYAVLLMSPALVITGVNRAYLDATGYSQDIVGQSLFDAFPMNPANPGSTNAAAVMTSITRAISTRQPHRTALLRYAVARHGAQGRVFEERCWSTVHTPFFDAAGEITCVAQNAMDITDLCASDATGNCTSRASSPQDDMPPSIGHSHWVWLHDAIRARQEADARLRETERRKDEFLAMLAHELRNPLAPISAAAQLLRMPGITPDLLRKTSDVIGRQVTHMTGLIEDLLDVSRVTRGLIVLDCKRLLIADIVTDALEQVRPLIETRQQTLSVCLPTESVAVHGDQKRLVQVLTNLLNNAAKYTPEHGALALHVSNAGTAIAIRVEDNGIGIAADLLPHVFDLFTQAERSSDRLQGGLGLGLTLVRSLVLLHGGSVTAVSAGTGQGSAFTVTLPRSVTHPGKDILSAIAGAPRHQERGLRLLVVDDNSDAADMLGAFMESAGHAVSIEHDPFKALERACLERPDVCLLDIGLPGMDGNALARRLRLLPQTANATLIAVTGYGKTFDRDTSLAAGFDYYFIKPADPTALVALLDKIQLADGGVV